MPGGPLFRLYRRSRLSGPELQQLQRRLLVVPMIAWTPLLLLSWLDGRALTGVALPFLHDVETHVRLLVALPLLVLTERIVHARMPEIVRQFIDRQLVPDDHRSAFEAAIASALRLRNSTIAELGLIAFVYAIGITFIWRVMIAVPSDTWYWSPGGGAMDVSRAGWWYMLVSVPMFQFLLFRWYYRLLLWAYFLWRVSRLPLALNVLHPDQSGGLGFLAEMPRALTTLLLAHGALAAGMFADAIFFESKSLGDYKIEIIVVVLFSLFLVVAPLGAFTPLLARTKRDGNLRYGALAQAYVRDFDRKWLRRAAPRDEPLIGTADIQSLADLGNSYGVLREMRLLPVDGRSVVVLAIAAVLPLTPLLLTMFSVNQLLKQMMGLFF